jgi:hypothetical protein
MIVLSGALLSACCVCECRFWGYVRHVIIIIIIIIINIKVWAIWPVPSPQLQLLSPAFLRSPDCSLSLWTVVV